MEKQDCPACGLKPQLVVFENREYDPMVSWLFCRCGTIYHDGEIDKKVFDEDYKEKVAELSDCRERYGYVVRQYVPFVEELTYGRKFLAVGHTLPFMIKEMQDRGWFSMGIDLIGNDYITGDFEEYDFKDARFDFIHLAHVLESFTDWKKALGKTRDLLRQLGVVLITTIGPQFVHELGYRKFGHWKPKEKKTFLSTEMIVKELEYHGMKLIAARENMNKRFLYWNDNHLIFQKVK